MNFLILISIAITAAILVLPRVANNTMWRATITPLASIVGSGFLVLGPILNASYGLYAPVWMAALCATAYLFGAAIRYNITKIAANTPRHQSEDRLETVASWVLSFAYIISVAYYLNLFGAFAVSLTPFDVPVNARIVSTVAFLLILFTGWTRGFNALERVEQIAVGVKLAIITGLLVGLAGYFGQAVMTSALEFNPPSVTGWGAVTLIFGLIVTVQGFETSRYLGSEYDAETRIRSMRLAQFISTVIYMVYIFLLAYVFAPDAGILSETAIIDMMEVVAPMLPFMLVLAALSAQLSAAIADTSGAGGLVTELTKGRVSAKAGYALLVCIGVLLTWTANIFEIISYASRAFALYYALQAALAMVAALRGDAARFTVLGYGALAVFGVAIVVFGVPVE